MTPNNSTQKILSIADQSAAEWLTRMSYAEAYDALRVRVARPELYGLWPRWYWQRMLTTLETLKLATPGDK